MTFTLLAALLLSTSADPDAVLRLAALETGDDDDDDDDDEEEEDVAEDEGDEEDEEDEEGEPFPWGTVSGVAIGAGGFLAGVGVSAAGAGALLLTAPGTDPGLSVAAYALLGTGAVLGLVGTGATGAGGALFWFTSEDDDESGD